MTLADICVYVMQMSLYGGFAILVAVLLGELLWKLRTPRVVVFALWAVVAVRLVCPIALPVPLMPAPVQSFVSDLTDFDAYAGDVQVAVHVPGDTGAFERAVDAGVAPVKTDLGFDAAYYYEQADGTITPARTERQTLLPTLALVWACGVAGMLLYGCTAQLLLRRKLRFAVKEGDVYLSDRIASPCVVGIFRPRIYLTFGLTEQQRQIIERHERAHIRHGDVVYKALGFLILSVHWFNPWVWSGFAYVMALLERACDERVLRELGEQARQEYGEVLLSQSVRRRFASAQPMCFGENNTKERVRHLLRFKRPVKWMAWLAAPVCLAAGLCLLGSAPQAQLTPLGATYEVQQTLYDVPVDGVAHMGQTAPQFRITAGYQLDIRPAGEGAWVRLGGLMRTHLSQRDLAQMFDAPFDGWDGATAIETVYRTNAQDVSYFVLQHRNGEVWLAVAPVWDETPHVRTVFQLRAVGAQQDDGYLAQSLSDAMGYAAPVQIFAQQTLPDGTLLVGFMADGQSAGSDMGCALLAYRGGRYELLTWTRQKGSALQGRGVFFATLVPPSGDEMGIVLCNDARVHAVRLVAQEMDRTQVLQTWQGVPEIPSMTVWEGALPQTDTTIFYYDAQGKPL